MQRKERRSGSKNEMTKFFTLSQELKARHVSSIGYVKKQNLICINHKRKVGWVMVIIDNIEETLDKFDFMFMHKMDSKTIQDCKNVIVENWSYIEGSAPLLSLNLNLKT